MMDVETETKLKIVVDSSDLDEAVEKANRLLALLQEVAKIIGSLSVDITEEKD